MLSYSWQQNVAEARFAEWLTVAAYLFAAIFCVLAARRGKAAGVAREEAFWWLIVVGLGVLAVNEVLDLQTLLTVIGKQFATSGGWYDERRLVQFVFIGVLAIALLLGGTLALYLTLHTHRALRLALLGLAFIGAFVLIRAASFHHMDEWLGRDLAFIDYGTAQEMFGIGLIALAAILYRPGGSRREHPAPSG